MRKTFFAYSAKTKAVTAQLINAFVFATNIVVQPLYFLNTNFQALCHLLWLYISRFVSDLDGNSKTGFLATRLNNDEDKRNCFCI